VTVGDLAKRFVAATAFAGHAVACSPWASERCPQAHVQARQPDSKALRTCNVPTPAEVVPAVVEVEMAISQLRPTTRSLPTKDNSTLCN
jgi:hypothetical protein